MPVDVVFIAGSGRSGSTLLDRVLGTLPGVSSHNELLSIPNRGLGENQRCSCGMPFRECGFWSRVIEVAGITDDMVPGFVEGRLVVDRLRTFPKIFLGLAGRGFARRLAHYRMQLARLYGAISAVTGQSVIVDSTKIPTHALILLGIPGIRVHVLHLVRDARDVAPAWKRRKFDPGTGRPMRYMSPWFASVSWLLENLFSGLLRRRAPYHRVRYEDLIDRPQETLDGICRALAPLRGRRVKIDHNNAVDLGTIHAISGNPDRFETGMTVIGRPRPAASGSWRPYRVLALLVCFPLLLTYGYLGSARAGSAVLSNRTEGR